MHDSCCLGAARIVPIHAWSSSVVIGFPVHAVEYDVSKDSEAPKSVTMSKECNRTVSNLFSSGSSLSSFLAISVSCPCPVRLNFSLLTGAHFRVPFELQVLQAFFTAFFHDAVSFTSSNLVLTIMNGNSKIVGGLPPPPGVTPNFFNPESLHVYNVICQAVCLPICTLVVLARILTKTRVKPPMGPEDCKSPHSLFQTLRSIGRLTP